jgi:pantoate--beta-alanine ligase
MIIFKKSAQLKAFITQEKSSNKKIGFVPTMGALHDGHLALINESRANNEITVCSIFVNPTQFNNKEDFNKYPATIESDIEKLEFAKCDILFFPAVDEIYPPDFEKRNYELGYIENILEGKYRPGHFQGVCQVVDQLLKIVEPHNLYMGQKDYQQCMVVKKLLNILEKEEEIKLHISNTVRERDGLAMSSRNLRLDAEYRQKAIYINQVLQAIQKDYRFIENDKLISTAKKQLFDHGFLVDYIEIRNADDLKEITGRETPVVVLVAATIDNIRLIDNLILN